MAEFALDAEIDLLPTEQGGRRGPVRNGFRPAVWFGETAPTGEPALHSVVLRLGAGQDLAPGQRGEVLISPLAYETWPDVRAGTHFDLYEAGRVIGGGLLRATPTRSLSEPELRRALLNALEEWVLERFGEQVERRPRLGKRFEPDLLAWFDDDDGERHALIGEIVARKPARRDVDRLARMMEYHGASFGLLVALDEASAATLDAIHGYGTVALPSEAPVPRIRIVTTRSLVRERVELLPKKRKPTSLQLLAA